MGRFLVGLLIGILIGTGGTMAITKQDIISATRTSAVFIQKATTIIAKHTDPQTAKEIVAEIIQETAKR